jgi:hypothetical protein
MQGQGREYYAAVRSETATRPEQPGARSDRRGDGELHPGLIRIDRSEPHQCLTRAIRFPDAPQLLTTWCFVRQPIIEQPARDPKADMRELPHSTTAAPRDSGKQSFSARMTGAKVRVQCRC